MPAKGRGIFRLPEGRPDRKAAFFIGREKESSTVFKTRTLIFGLVLLLLAAVAAGWLSGPLDRWIAKLVGSEQP